MQRTFSRCSEHLVDAANIFNSVVKISRDSTEFEEGILTEFQNSIRRNPSLLEFRRHFFWPNTGYPDPSRQIALHKYLYSLIYKNLSCLYLRWDGWTQICWSNLCWTPGKLWANHKLKQCQTKISKWNERKLKIHKTLIILNHAILVHNGRVNLEEYGTKVETVR